MTLVLPDHSSSSPLIYPDAATFVMRPHLIVVVVNFVILDQGIVRFSGRASVGSTPHLDSGIRLNVAVRVGAPPAVVDFVVANRDVADVIGIRSGRNSAAASMAHFKILESDVRKSNRTVVEIRALIIELRNGATVKSEVRRVLNADADLLAIRGPRVVAG